MDNLTKRRALIAERHAEFLEWRKRDTIYAEVADAEAFAVFDFAASAVMEERLHIPPTHPDYEQELRRALR